MSRKAIRRTAVAAAAVVGLATGTTSTAEAIVNGQPIPIEQAPWTVYLTATNTYGTNACTGSIIEASRVLTAAHCVLRSGGQPAPNITVLAGTANSAGAGQRVVASSVRAHPYSENGYGADDIAVVTLQRPLDLSGPTAQAIPMIAPGPTPVMGTQVTAMGFGAHSPTAPGGGPLTALGHVLVDPYLGINASCAGAGMEAAVNLCPQSDVGAICFGDSGGPLVTGAPPVLVGVASRGTGKPPGSAATEDCMGGKPSGYVNLSAPEIRAFIDGNDQPPLAPRLSGTISSGFASSRSSKLVCESDPWQNAPALTYTWRDARTGTVLRTGRTYRIRRGDKGRELACAVTASNPGGTVTRSQFSGLRVSRSVMAVLNHQRKKALRACAKKRSRAGKARCRKGVKRRFG